MTLFDLIYKASVIGGFGVLVWYATETMIIRKINKQQMDLQLLPAMMIYMRRTGGSTDSDPDHYRLVIRNVGKGTATTVMPLPTIFHIQGKRIEFRFRLSDQNNTLIADEERELELDSYIDGQSNAQNMYRDFHRYFSPYSLGDAKVFKKAKMVKQDAPTKNMISVKFKDIHGQAYTTVIGFEPSGISILESPSRTNNFNSTP